MANSDYTVRVGGFGFCPMGVLAAPIGPLDAGAVMSGYTSPIPNGIRIGMAAAIGDEIVVVNGNTGDNLLLGRGCCDTVPVAHAAGELIWFFDDSIGNDSIEYAGSETLGVKVLPRTTSSPYVAVEKSPPVAVTFNFRFARPYPPGKVLANGSPWHLTHGIANTDGLVLTWAHRDRITQQDQLVDHSQASIGPEIGTTYTVKVYSNAGTLLRTVTGIAGTTWTYSQANIDIDFAPDETGYLTLTAVCAGLDSYQNYRVNFSLSTVDDPYGLGYRLGQGLGGVAPI